MTIRRRNVLAGSVAAIIGLSTAAFLLWNPPDTLHIHVEVIRDDAGHLARRWTFTAGRRRWESYGHFVRDGEHVVVLNPPGALDGGAVRYIKGLVGKGANKITYQIEMDSLATGGGDVTIKRMMKGNNGGTPAFSSESIYQTPADGSAARGLVVEERDAIVRLPARVRLGSFGGTAEVIHFR